MTRLRFWCASLSAIVIGAGAGGGLAWPAAAVPGQGRSSATVYTAPPQARGVPAFEVDPLWPRPLPDHWILGSVTGVAVDARDQIWLVHRGADSLTARTENGLGTNPPTAEYCCRPAPPVLRFDRSGALTGRWGGPGQGYDWPQSPGGLAVDASGHVWIAAAGPPEPAPGRGGRGGAAPPAAPRDAHVLKFTSDGRFVLQIGRSGEIGGPDSTTTLNRPSAVDVDSAAGEVYVADTGSRRVVVFDAATGAHKRHWGAYGGRPAADDPGPYDPAGAPARQFRSASCVSLSRDGHVYVCDRTSNRVQVFRKDGTFVREAVVAPATRGGGSVWDVAFSADAGQQYLFVANGQDQIVHILARDTLAVVGEFGAGGRWPGHFFGVGSVAVDSQGAVYTGEALEGKRLQKFNRK